MTGNKRPNVLSKREIFLRGTIIAIILTVPSLTGFVISWMVTDNMLTSAIVGGIIHFIAMGFSLKISKKLLVRR